MDKLQIEHQEHYRPNEDSDAANSDLEKRVEQLTYDRRGDDESDRVTMKTWAVVAVSSVFSGYI